jgi:hypothetical protein
MSLEILLTMVDESKNRIKKKIKSVVIIIIQLDLMNVETKIPKKIEQTSANKKVHKPNIFNIISNFLNFEYGRSIATELVNYFV